MPNYFYVRIVASARIQDNRLTLLSRFTVKLLALLCACIALSSLLNPCRAQTTAPFRPPAVPLVTSDPYLSIWSDTNRLTDAATIHWTHHDQALVSLIRIDGKTFRLMGNDPADAPALPQLSLSVLPTRTIYTFGNNRVQVTMTFLSPALPNDLTALSLPLSYITWSIRSVDGVKHAISLYDSVSSELAVNSPDQAVVWSRTQAGPLTALKVGTKAQTLFEPADDDARIDWGYAYLAASTSQTRSCVASDKDAIQAFESSGSVPKTDDSRMPRAVSDQTPVLAFTFDLGQVGASPITRHVIVAYDEIYSIDFFGEKLRPYWRRNGANAQQMLARADAQYPVLTQRCANFDRNLMADLTREGGARYAQIAALAYRQALAACGLAADRNGKPLLFTKENTSNGDMATVDVFFPMDPVLVFLSPTLAKASLVPILAYAASPHWHFPNAPHDLGTYPQAFGRDDGGEAMPVEESGNMLILCDAVAHDDGNAQFAAKWWPQLTQWAHFLEQYGIDPGDQLCTDDFMGHLDHNANLSVKAIVALAAYGDLCRMRGDHADAEKYTLEARADARHWVHVCDTGSHSLLAFNLPGTWSQKYNLVWDHILGLNVFPPRVAQKEIAYYKTRMQPYGLPLDSRTHLTKTDWSLWSASMATSRADFESFVTPIYDYLGQTTSRDMLADSYMTDDLHSDGMHARPVVGGLFIKMLTDPAVWRKWSSQDRQNPTGWALLPAAPKLTVVIPSSQHKGQTWRYTTAKPANGNWVKPTFDDSSWLTGVGGFGTAGTPGAVIGTTWNTDDIWLRRTITMPPGNYTNLQFWVYHDEDIDVYVNGVPAASEPGYVSQYELLQISPAARALLKPGAKITLAVHCHQTTGGQDIDVGLDNVSYPN
jgi:hypothetical protein